MSEYYGVASTPTEDFIAHYGIKGMKWGVRKAIQSGSDRALRRQYKKASKKLAKLEKLGASGKKYGKRAALYGAGAAAAGGLAAVGTKGVGKIVRGAGGVMQEVGYGASRLAGKYLGNSKTGQAIRTAGQAVGRAGTAAKESEKHINAWGNSRSISDKATQALEQNFRNAKGVTRTAAGRTAGALNGVSNNTLARIGAGAIGAGLGVAAGRNAYRAATAKKHAAQAQQFRAEMNKAFAGTKYANGMPYKKKKSRRG